MRKSIFLLLPVFFVGSLFAILVSPDIVFAESQRQPLSNYNSEEISYVPGELLVTLKESNNILTRQSKDFHSRMIDAIPNYQKSVKWESSVLGVSLIKVKEGDELEQIEILQQNPEIRSVSLNTIHHARGHVISIDPDFPLQWHLNSTRIPQSWQHTTGSSNTTVAVIDTGIDLNHSDLLAGIWNNTDDSCSGGVDDDTNGKVDDCRGWDFVNDDNDPTDDENHGTFVSGIIGARLNHIFGASVAPNISLMPIKVLDDAGSGTVLNVIAGIYYAVDNGADVINMSLGAYGPCDGPMQDAVNYANVNGVVFVVAAGESALIDEQDSWPSCDHVISVIATDNFDQSTSYSDWVETNDLAAPGGDSELNGGSPDSLPVYSTILGNSFGSSIGTSFAAPHVAGCAALIKSINSTLGADYIQSKMEELSFDLTDSGYTPNNATVGKDIVFGWGLLQCDAVILAEDVVPPSFMIQYYSDPALTTTLDDNPQLKAGTYYLKITSNEDLSGPPIISISSQGFANNVVNSTASHVLGNDYTITRNIAIDALSTGSTLEDISITGTDIAGNISSNIDPINEASKAAFIDTILPNITSVIPASSSLINQFNIAYSLGETVPSGTVTFTRTGGAADGLTHIYNFTSGDKTSGTHIISKQTLEGSFGSLVDGTIYKMTIAASDAALNTRTVERTSLTYSSTVGNCSTPPSVDWLFESGCKISNDVIASGNVEVKNGAIITIESGNSLDLDFITKKLTIHYGSGILIKSGAKIE